MNLTLEPMGWGPGKTPSAFPTGAPNMYEVKGLPTGQRVRVKEHHRRWQILRSAGEDGSQWEGDFDSQEAVLAALHAEYGGL